MGRIIVGNCKSVKPTLGLNTEKEKESSSHEVYIGCYLIVNQWL